MDPNMLAKMNFQQQLCQNLIPEGSSDGRSSVMNAWLIIYWIMGRSQSSQNRRLSPKEACLEPKPLTLRG